jgi:hypothetical protein
VKNCITSELGTSDICDGVDMLATSEGCDSDTMIARMLQLQFDKEHDEMLKRTEAKFNGTSKGTEITMKSCHITKLKKNSCC